MQCYYKERPTVEENKEEKQNMVKKKLIDGLSIKTPETIKRMTKMVDDAFSQSLLAEVPASEVINL